jgi:predicted Zn-dependent protease
MLLCSACAKPVVQTPYFSEEQVAQEAAVQKAYAEQGREITEEPLTEYELTQMKQRLERQAAKVKNAGMKLCSYMGMDMQECTYSTSLTVEDEKNLNAYADGEAIFITPMMMRFAKDNDHLGVILSHEYAHNIMGHVTAKKRNAMAGFALGALVDIVAGTQGISTQGMGSQLGMGAGIRAFSPEFEREADYVGLYVAALAGYDIAKAPELWRAMTSIDPKGAFLTGSHPSNPERYVLLEQTKQEIVNKVRSGKPLVPNIRPE